MDGLTSGIGVNVIPAVGWTKKPIVKWTDWQSKPIPIELHEEWKSKCLFKNGMAIVLGRVWHRKDREDCWLTAVDIDNKIAVNELVDDLNSLANNTYVEHYPDVEGSLHQLMYCKRPILDKEPDPKDPSKPWFEVKCLKKILYCTPSPKANGVRRQIIGTYEPKILGLDKCDEFESRIDAICKKYGFKYLENHNTRCENNKAGQRIELDDNQITAIVGKVKLFYQNGVRDWLVFSLSGFLYKIGVSTDSTLALIQNLTDNDRKAAAVAENTYNKSRDQVVGYRRLIEIMEQTTTAAEAKRIIEDISEIISPSEQESPKGIINQAVEELVSKYHFATFSDTDEILYYKDGVYVKEGEVLIRKEIEEEFGKRATIHICREAIDHIRRRSYHKRSEFDADVNILNLKNGLYNIAENRLDEHNPDYFSLNQKPIVYNNEATTTLFRKFLSEVLYASDIKTMIDLMAYTFWRENPFEIITYLHGYGGNGKSVVFNLLAALHGEGNVSHVSLKTILGRPFGLYELVDKDLNLDAELSSGVIEDTAILKKLTGRERTHVAIGTDQSPPTQTSRSLVSTHRSYG
jgi:putative DNA primase/helicase